MLGTAAIIAIIIGGLALIVVPIVAYILVRYERKRSDLALRELNVERMQDKLALRELNVQRMQDKLKQDKVRTAFEKTLGGTSSYTVEHIEFICTFDESGSGTSERRIHGLRATQRIQNLEIPFASKLPDPRDGAEIAGVIVKALPASTVPVRWQEDDRRGGQIHGKIIVDGLLTPDGGVAAYSVQTQHRFGFTMTAQEADEAYRDADWKAEYVMYSMLTPGVKRLTIVVNFPASHHHLTPPPSGVVFIAGQEVLDREETPLVRDLVTYDNGTATLVVDNPKPLVRYAITWRPPDRK